MNDIDAGRHPRSSTGDLYRKGNRLWNHLQRRTMEGKTVLTALVTGTVNPKDAKDSEAYKITVVYSDGSKAVLRKKYDEFVDLQVKVYDLLKQKGGYSRKTARTLISSLPENNSALSRLLYKDSDLKKMGRIDKFIKELLTLPTAMQESEVIGKFFCALHGQVETIERSSEEEKLKNGINVAEKISGRDPLRDIPQQSPSPRGKARCSFTCYPKDLHALTDKSRELLYQKLNNLNERCPSKKIPLPGKASAASVDDEVLDKKTAPRPGLKESPFTVPFGMADMFKESKELKERNPADELSKQQSGSDESISAQESLMIDSEHLEVDTRSRKVSSQFVAREERPVGRVSPVRTKYAVISLFIAEESGEVSLEEGEEVEVLQKEPSGWWYVKNDFCEGWAPSAFLEPAADSRSTSPGTTYQPDQPDNQDEFCQIRGKLDFCPRQPDDMEQEKRFVQQENLKRRGDSGYTSPRDSTSEIESESQDESHRENIVNSRLYRAMHSYISQEDGEVSFMEGDEVEVIQRSENGWWLVQTSEELGWGPSNFLQSLAY